MQLFLKLKFTLIIILNPIFKAIMHFSLLNISHFIGLLFIFILFYYILKYIKLNFYQFIINLNYQFYYQL